MLSIVDKIVIIGVKFNTYDEDLCDLIRELSNKIQIIIIDPNALLLAEKFGKNALPIISHGEKGSRFEDIFALNHSNARKVFEDVIGLKIRDLFNFTKEKPQNPFFEVPIAM